MPVKNQHDTEKLIAKYQPQLKSFIRNRVANREDAEDILQDVFYQLVKTVNTAMNPIEEVSAWLYRVARNTIINHAAKKREEEMPAYRRNDDGDMEMLEDFSEVLFSNDGVSPSPETEYMRSLVWTELENALAELPPEQREIYELTEMDGIPVKEIARTTGIPVNTLLSRKHYAVLHLRKRMRELYNAIISL
ncbi:MAG: sigma-70 family RNA polymerase sigma factor [Dysgonamonadaceae bacterium]|jgi:RNA polymerase sigma factor (sigma-70 family)|nr:sigma-70 family RNA polymerase sigma factor [Dysgonamonadaceae bacterium]